MTFRFHIKHFKFVVFNLIYRTSFRERDKQILFTRNICHKPNTYLYNYTKMYM